MAIWRQSNVQIYFGRRKKKADQKAKEGEKTDASSVEREFFYF